MANLIGQKVDRYEIRELIGEGGMATVYKAYDTRLEREVAIKFTKRGAFPPDHLEMILKRFEREAKSLGRLSHPNIVGVLDYGEHEGVPYLVMPYLPGGTLKQQLGRPIPWRDAVQKILPIARALQYVHDHNIINRDVKPSNILLTENGEAMLTDFGLVKLFEGKDTQQLTASGAGIGTPDYMAPEQWTGEATALSDMYSLGVVLYEMITGYRPYVSDTPAGVLLKQVNEPLPPPNQYIPDLPNDIEAVLLKVLARKPENRYPNMNAFANDLQSILTGGPATATAVPTEQLREQMTGKIKRKEIEETRQQIEQIQKERAATAPLPSTPLSQTSQPSMPVASQPAKSKSGMSLAIVAAGVVGLFVLCVGCWFTYSFVRPMLIKPTEEVIPTPLISVTTPPAEENTPTASVPTDTPAPATTPTITPTLVILPQQWNGTYKQAGFDSTPISVLLEKLNGLTFTGRMVWTGGTNYRGAITAIEGEYVTDFGDAEEQAKWNKHPDYASGDRSGTWLKWTETKFVAGGGYTLGGWYYGHIGSDGAMVGIYFLNDQLSSLANDLWKLKLVK